MGRNKITFHKGHTINNGRVLTEEHKEKIRTGMLNSDKKIGRRSGGVPWNKGKTFVEKIELSEEEKIKKKKEIKENLRAMRLGKKHSPETIEKMKGRVPWNKGKKTSIEVRKKQSAAAKRKPKYTEETIRKMLERRTPSSLEIKFEKIINKYNLPYRFVGDGSFSIGRKNPDFINTNGEKLAIEVFSKYYKLRHNKTIQEWKDERTKIFSEYDWRILFFDEVEVKENNVVDILRRQNGIGYQR